MAKEKLNQDIVLKAHEWGYESAANRMPGFDSAYQLADNYNAKGGNPRKIVQVVY